MVKCPNCGSTAQIAWLWNDDNIYSTKRESDFKCCGCGCDFTVKYEMTATEIIGKEDK